MGRKIGFTVNQAYLFEMMQGQTEGLPKALAELIMNSADAGAKQVDIELNQNNDNYIEFSVKDNGRGFSKKDILENFAKFGTPHEQNDALFGRFRLGRSQILTIAKTSWHTRKYIMDIDLQSALADKNLNNMLFDLKSTECNVRGCHISGVTYKEYLYSNDIRSIILDVKEIVEHIDITVMINGVKINSSAKDLKKDKKYKKNNYFEDEFAHYFINGIPDSHGSRGSDIQLYNLGVLVNYNNLNLSMIDALVITKQHLKLDHSRRIPLTENCPVWQGIYKKLLEIEDSLCEKCAQSVDIHNHHLVKIAAKLKNTDPSKLKYSSAIEQLVTKELFLDHGRNPISLLRLFGNTEIGVCHSTDLKHDRIAKIEQIPLLLMEYSNANVLSALDNCSDYYSNTIEFLNQCCQLWVNNNPNHFKAASYQPFHEKNINYYSDKYDVTYSDTLPSVVNGGQTHESVLSTLQILNDFAHPHLATHLKHNKKRDIQLGTSNFASAWTNSTDLIAFDAKTAGEYIQDGNINSLLMLLIHEYCHTTEDSGHTKQFYELFHDTLQAINIFDIVKDVKQYLSENPHNINAA